VKLSGLGNLGMKTSAPKARDSRSSSSEKRASSFEETLGSKSDAKIQDQPKQALKQEASKQETPKKETSKQEFTKAPVAKRDDNNPTAAKVVEAQADKTESADQDGDIHAESFGGDGLPSQASAPSLNGSVQDRVLNADPDHALTASLLKQPEVKKQDEGVDSLTRRVVWTDFLRKMKEDLDIDAQDVLNAFQGLSDEELAQPPQDTVNAVVANLGLDGSQATLARKYFNELVTKTKSKSMGEELETSGRQIHLTLMSQRDMQRKALEHSLERMNQNFWMKNPPQTQRPQEPQASPFGPTPVQAQAQSQAQIQNQNQNQHNDQMMVLGPDGLVPASRLSPTLKDAAAAPQTPAPMPAHDSKMAALDKMNQLPQAGQLASPSAPEKNTVDELVRQFLSPQAKMETLKAGEIQAQPMAAASTTLHAQPAATASQVMPQVMPQAAAPLEGLKAILGDSGQSQSQDSDDDGDLQADGTYLNQLGAHEHAKGALMKGAEFQGELAKAGAPQPMTVPELVDKAQIMLHDGGGEMKVTMSPDGLGEVAMRVSVHDGKVQVQMITESDEAKRMIERHVGELKGQLTQNNLHIDSIKIDTATNLGKQLEQQYHDAQRQMAHQSLEQFRQDQQGWRRSFFEVPSARQYKGQADALRDVSAPSGVSASARTSNAKRRLDLVA
jgi:flagellar hook-length control protein FliK